MCKPSSTKARQAQSRLKALERLQLIAPAHVDTPFHFRFREPESLPRPLLRLEQLAAGYGSTRVLDAVSLTLAPGDRIALLGPNGAGKSTLIKTLAGEQSTLAGTRSAAQGLQIGYFAQHQMDQLRSDDSPLEHLIAIDPDIPEQPLRDFLGGFGFSGDQATRPVAPFSGGERARLALALIVYQQPNLLLLDEPTNHLDLEMRHALSAALQDYQGAVVLVSHDRHLLRITCDQLLLVDDGRLAPFDGDLDDYPTWISRRAAQRRSAASSGETVTSQPADGARIGAAAKKASRRREAEQRARSQPLRRRLAELEQRLQALSETRRAIDAQLSNSELYEPDAKPRLLALMEDKRRVDGELADVEHAWLETGEALEQLGAQQA
jgi:ATP-binding cassette subfamily F protein 3